MKKILLITFMLLFLTACFNNPKEENTNIESESQGQRQRITPEMFYFEIDGVTVKLNSKVIDLPFNIENDEWVLHNNVSDWEIKGEGEKKYDIEAHADVVFQINEYPNSKSAQSNLILQVKNIPGDASSPLSPTGVRLVPFSQATVVAVYASNSYNQTFDTEAFNSSIISKIRFFGMFSLMKTTQSEVLKTFGNPDETLLSFGADFPWQFLYYEDDFVLKLYFDSDTGVLSGVQYLLTNIEGVKNYS